MTLDVVSSQWRHLTRVPGLLKDVDCQPNMPVELRYNCSMPVPPRAKTSMTLDSDRSSDLSVQAFSFAIDPTSDQESAIRRHFGARRYSYNWTVAEIRRELTLYRECGASFGPPSLARLRKRWHRDKHRLAVDAEGVPWWTEVSKEAFSNGIADAVTADWNWQKSRSGTRNGHRVGFPRFKRKGRDEDRYRVTTGSFGACDRRPCSWSIWCGPKAK